MKSFRSGGLSLFLAMVMTTTMLVALPLKAFAADATIAIASTDSVADIDTAINAAIVSVDTAGGGTVTVTGNKNDADESLNLFIPNSVNVVWQADYDNTTAASFSGGSLIFLSNPSTLAGTFEVAAGTVESSKNGVGVIEASNGSHAWVRVTGGSVIASGIGSNAINAKTASIMIINGYVEANDASALTSAFGNIYINGGSVKSSNIAIDTLGGNVEINGGIVEADIQTVVVDNGTILVSAGTVICTDLVPHANSAAITVGVGSTAKVIGGSVISITSAIYANGGVAAYLSGTCTGAFIVPDASGGMVVEVDMLSIPVAPNGTNAGLTTKAGGLSAIWETTNSAHVISFALADGRVASISWNSWSWPFSCEIVGGIQYAFLDEALFFAKDGETIRLLQDITFYRLYIDNGKDFTLDLAGFTLNSDSSLAPVPSVPGSSPGFIVTNSIITVVGGTITVTNAWSAVSVSDDGIIKLGKDGVFNITDSIYGVSVFSGGKATVTSVTDCGFGHAVSASGSGSELTVTGDVSASGPGCIGVEVYDGGLVVVEGNVNISGNNSVGVYSSGLGSGAEIAGNVIASGENAIGAQVNSSGAVIVHGTITAPNYIDLNGTIVTAADFVKDYKGIETLYFEGFLLYMADNYQGFVYVGNNSTILPPTGDNTGLLGGTVVLLAALLGMSGIVAWRKRRQEV